MNVTMKKSMIAAAVAMAFASTGAHAAAVTGFKIMDIGQTNVNTGFAAGSSNNASNYSAVTDGRSAAFAFKNTTSIPFLHFLMNRNKFILFLFLLQSRHVTRSSRHRVEFVIFYTTKKR